MIAADDFFRGFLETALAPDEIITEVRVPKTSGAGWAFEKFNRRAQDWAIVGVAAVGGDTPGVALVNMGSTPVPRRAVSRPRCATARRRPTPRPRRPTAPSHRPISTRRPSTAATWRACSSAVRSRPSPTPPPEEPDDHHHRSAPARWSAFPSAGSRTRRSLRGEGTYIDNLDLPGVAAPRVRALADRARRDPQHRRRRRARDAGRRRGVLRRRSRLPRPRRR